MIITGRKAADPVTPKLIHSLAGEYPEYTTVMHDPIDAGVADGHTTMHNMLAAAWMTLSEGVRADYERGHAGC